ncbi:MAG: outer membrane protein assembly factor BamE [Alphaproteobacteria bacterium]
MIPRSTAFKRTPILAGMAGAVALLLAGCATPGSGGFGQTTQHGYIASDAALQQVPVGSSRDQVLIALGTPSTIGDFGGEVFYYISQTRRRAAMFLDARIVEQRVLAIYFNADDRVTQIADYGLQDGSVFNFTTMTTPTGGEDLNFISQILRGVFG